MSHRAIAFDREYGTVLKMGDPALVQANADNFRAATRDSGLDRFGADIVVATGDFDDETWQAVRDCSGYLISRHGQAALAGARLS